MENLGLTIHALRRVLSHLSEEQQAKMPRYSVRSDRFQARAQARVIINRKLAHYEHRQAQIWQATKDLR